MYSNAILLFKVKTKYKLILRKQKGCETSLWLNNNNSNNNNNKNTASSLIWSEESNVTFRTPAINFLINIYL